jgi:S1-C subfamily serine protease
VPVNDHICKGFGLSLRLTFNPDRNVAQEAVLELGENVVNIGFPLQSLMTDAPTVTRGTLSSRAGLNGSLGQFQFSAPIQPGASGGPVIGARGDVVGVAVGTLNAQELLKQGVLPQNVNFALEAQYVQNFCITRPSLSLKGPPIRISPPTFRSTTCGCGGGCVAA